MSVQSFSMNQFPEEIWGEISKQCDIKTVYAFRSTCKSANRIGTDCMSEVVAARIIFHHPEKYLSLRENGLKESRIVTLNALTKCPEIIFDSALPEQWKSDVEMIKTAYVAALCLNTHEVNVRLWSESAGELRDVLERLSTEFELYKARVCSPCQELLELQPFLLYVGRKTFDFPDSFFEHLPERTKKHIDIALSLLRQNPYLFRLMDESLRDNEELANVALKDNSWLFEFVGNRLKDDCSLVWKLLWKTYGNLYRFSSPRVRSNVPLALVASCINKCNLDHFGPELQNSPARYLVYGVSFIAQPFEFGVRVLFAIFMSVFKPLYDLVWFFTSHHKR